MLVGKEVILRRIEKADLWQLWKWHEENELYLFKDLNEFISWNVLSENFNKYFGRKGGFIIEDPKGKAVGVCTYEDINWKNRSAKLDLQYPGPEATFATDAIEILLAFLFEEMGMSRVFSYVPDFLLLEQLAVIKAGFIPEGRLREAIYWDGEYHDILTYGILKEEFGKVE